MRVFCPSCGSPVDFRYDDSFVRVCDRCGSALARTDRGIDTIGQYADLAPAASGLRLGASGRWQGQPFVLSGRAEYAHPAGGSWEEWYIKLGDGRWGWLSHAHGRWALSFKVATSRALPTFEQIAPGMPLTLGAAPGVTLVVGERNLARLSGAEGELPFLSAPGAESRFADLSDERGRFATLDYGPRGESGEPDVYLGRETHLGELGLAAAEAAELPEATRAGQRLGCPNCGGSIELRVPGRSLVVTCPYCNSLLDCEGPLAILARSAEVDRGRLAIPLGAVGTLYGVEYTITGQLRRKATFPGGFVEWDEYLLFSPRGGYRWLVYAGGHFSFVSPLPPGAVRENGPLEAIYQGRTYKLFDRGVAEVTAVWGEFYWKVSVGETVATSDYVSPPAMLSQESSESEMHWSLGIYLPVQEVERIFQCKPFPDPRIEVAPNQPFAHRHWFGVTVVLAGLFLVCLVLRALMANEHPLYAGNFLPANGDGTLALGASSTPGGPMQVFFTPSFELSARSNVRVDLSMPLSNSWAFVSVDLVNEASGELRSYSAELSYYSGVEDGESWSEGSWSDTHVFGAGGSGAHVLRLELQTPSGGATGPLHVAVIENVLPFSQVLLAFLALAAPAGLLALLHLSFERKRWENSDFAPAGMGGESDD